MRWTAPAPSKSEIRNYYLQTYYGNENVRFNFFFEKMTHYFQARRASVLKRRATRGPILDVGCGRGFLLKYLGEQGYQPYGIERSDNAAWHARNRLGLNVITTGLVEGGFSGERFNVLVFWHSLEHLDSPFQAIARARELLKPNGIMAIAVPNSESLQARIFGRHWFHLDIPRHYFHFGTRSLTTLLQQHGFRVVKVDHFCLEQNPFGWIQSIYNAAGFSNNLLYELLKSKSTRTKRASEWPVQTLVILATLPVVVLLSLVMTVVEACLRCGGTIEVYSTTE
jgi:2-polyprenyl-3-methyl-5-hydroxy-6-metoxy-1,4-benzoquinol methylase